MQIQLRLMQVLIMSQCLSSHPARQGAGCHGCSRKRVGFALAVSPTHVPWVPSLLHHPAAQRAVPCQASPALPAPWHCLAWGAKPSLNGKASGPTQEQRECCQAAWYAQL